MRQMKESKSERAERAEETVQNRAQSNKEIGNFIAFYGLKKL